MKTALVIKKLALLGIICAPAPVTYVAHDKIKPAVEQVKKRISPARKKHVRRPVVPAPPCVPVTGTGYAVPLAAPFSVPERGIDLPGYDFSETPGSATIQREAPELLSPIGRNGPGVIVFTPVQPPMIPEPGTWASMLLGFGVMGIITRKQGKRNERQPSRDS